jgi:hypothetical protein
MLQIIQILVAPTGSLIDFEEMINRLDIEQLQELSEVAGQIDGSHKECGA